MKHRRLTRLICAVCLTVCTSSFVYRASASVRPCTQEVSAAKEAPRVLLEGRRLVTFAGYELNASFTPGGEFFRFELRAEISKQ